MKPKEIPLRDFQVLTAGGSKRTATFWILLHPKGGVVLLNADQNFIVQGRRAVGLFSTDGRLTENNTVGTPMSLRSSRNLLAAALLPEKFPKGGPKLLDIAIKALEEAHSPTPLLLKEGRSEEDLRKILRAMATLKGEHHSLNCWHDAAWEPSWIRNPRDLHGDLFAWFQPRSWNAHGIAREHWGTDTDVLCWVRESPIEEPSAHDLIDAANTLLEFYRVAAGELGIERETVALRLQRYGVELPDTF